MPISATYVSTTSFTVATDLTTDFVSGRALLLDCGEDGNKYGYVNYSSYSSPNTTVYLDSTDSQAISSNLDNVDFSVFKYQPVSGNQPLEMLWMSRGVQTIAVTYKDADELTLKPGVVHIDDDTTEALYQCPGFDKQLTSLSASTWYYVYAKAPTNGRVLSATEIEYATSAPSLVSSKQGYYHATNTGWRCIGIVRANASSNILPFSVDGGIWKTQDENIATDINGATPSNTFTAYTITLPLGSISAVIAICGVYANQATSLLARTTGMSGAGRNVLFVGASTYSLDYSDITIRVSSSKQIDIKWGAATTNTLYVYTQGFHIPSEIFSSG